MTEQSQFRHWLSVALILACAAGAALPALGGPHPADSSNTEKAAPKTAKKSKAERRAEERQAREEREHPSEAAPTAATGAAATTPSASPTIGAVAAPPPDEATGAE